ncbi:restriction endonuclease subunit S [Sporolactobacillus inulinus]|uniref:restriction endonuclease subunit S n=1 Tax=Sporolactobacillus inulinus TaxID=2078 RepID=UPI00069984CD|nr:restriction endonuclease subunit S [Sporolactobacillus inulinus]GEB77381.1 hypothetical protein SIN01_17260 [Sporolactobacillus inulinus]
MRFKYVRLGDVAIYLKEKIYTNKIRLNNYVSTENLKPDIGGVDSSNKLPTTKMITKFNKWNILISNIRPYFKKIWLADWSGGCSNDVLVLKATDKINIFYLYYNLACDRFFDFVMAGAKGTKMPRGDKDHIMKYELMLPSIDCQKFIADILSTLDQKIQINSKINQNLEATAQAIFKHWFVDFEFPNEEGKPYKSSGGEMVDSELGLIPKGWKLGFFKHLITSVVGGDWGRTTCQGNYTHKVNVVRGADIPEISVGNKGNVPTRFILEKNYERKALRKGNLVVEISGGSPTQSTGRITYISQDVLKKFDSDLVCTNFCRVLTLNHSSFIEFVYLYWQQLYDSGVFFLYENGTTGIKNLDIDSVLKNYSIIQPPDKIIDNFHQTLKDIYKKIQVIGEENTKLSMVRDTLLPKLMSGEIRVPMEVAEQEN